MANEDQIEGLRQIIEEEKKAARDRFNLWYANLSEEEKKARHRAKHLRRKASGKQEEYNERRRQLMQIPELRKQATEIEKQRYNKILETKAGRTKPTACEVCSATEYRIVYDHHHGTNKFRGWLCTNCNLALGSARDSPTILEKLAVYLRTHEGSG